MAVEVVPAVVVASCRSGVGLAGGVLHEPVPLLVYPHGCKQPVQQRSLGGELVRQREIQSSADVMSALNFQWSLVVRSDS